MSEIKPGDIFSTFEGSRCIVLEYLGWDKVKIRFLDEHSFERFVRAEHLRSGKVKNPYHPTFFGVGYMGVGEFSSRSEAFNKWRQMIRRCYCQKYQEKHPAYSGCTVDAKWHNYQTFAAWITLQPRWNEKGWELDKDLLTKGNKIYREDTCTVIPKHLNLLIASSRSGRGMPTGVCWDSRNSKYMAYCNDQNGQRKHLGYFDCVDGAFLAYKEFKESVVRHLAGKYKGLIRHDAFCALMNYEVKP